MSSDKCMHLGNHPHSQNIEQFSDVPTFCCYSSRPSTVAILNFLPFSHKFSFLTQAFIYTTITVSETLPLFYSPFKDFPGRVLWSLFPSFDWSPLNSYERRWNCFYIGMWIRCFVKLLSMWFILLCPRCPSQSQRLSVSFEIPGVPFTIFCSLDAINRNNLQNVNELHFPKS